MRIAAESQRDCIFAIAAVYQSTIYFKLISLTRSTWMLLVVTCHRTFQLLCHALSLLLWPPVVRWIGHCFDRMLLVGAGGGLPVGAYGGRRDIMEMVAPAGPMYQVCLRCSVPTLHLILPFDSAPNHASAGSWVPILLLLQQSLTAYGHCSGSRIRDAQSSSKCGLYAPDLVAIASARKGA